MAPTARATLDLRERHAREADAHQKRWQSGGRGARRFLARSSCVAPFQYSPGVLGRVQASLTSLAADAAWTRPPRARIWQLSERPGRLGTNARPQPRRPTRRVTVGCCRCYTEGSRAALAAGLSTRLHRITM